MRDGLIYVHLMVLRTKPRSFALVLLILAFRVAAAERDPAFSPIQVTLVPGQDALVPGETFTLGIHQRMLLGYHTYWKNPGTLGMALSMKWQLPEGFVASPIRWPVPMVTRMASYDVWGYEGEALLLVDLKVPGNLRTGQEVSLKGLATWMCCSDQCYPEARELALTLPVRDRASPDEKWSQRLERVREQQPEKPPGWKVTCAEVGETFRLQLAWRGDGKRPQTGRIHFFGDDRQVSSSKPQVVVMDGDRVDLVLPMEEHAPESLSRLKGILVAEHSWGGGVEVLKVDVALE